MRFSLKTAVTSSRALRTEESSMESSSPMFACWAIIFHGCAVPGPGRSLKTLKALHWCHYQTERKDGDSVTKWSLPPPKKKITCKANQSMCSMSWKVCAELSWWKKLGCMNNSVFDKLMKRSSTECKYLGETLKTDTSQNGSSQQLNERTKPQFHSYFWFYLGLWLRLCLCFRSPI